MKLLDRQPQENARSYAIRILTHNIITLALEPGSAVSENELSTVLNLSRTPIREALIELQKHQLVEIYPQRGSYIAKIDYDLIEETRFMRITLENAIIELACEGIDESYKNKLHQNILLQKSCLPINDKEQLIAYDHAFHRLLFEAVNKSRIYEILQIQLLHFDRLRLLRLKNVNDVRMIEDHENILYAMERGDKELATMLMATHMSRDKIDKDKLRDMYPTYFK